MITNVSEHPSESCSILDESENVQVSERSRSHSKGSKSSDKENSNIESNKSKDIQTPHVSKPNKTKIS